MRPTVRTPHAPYIGVTGFTNTGATARAVEVVDAEKIGLRRHKLMIGVLADDESLKKRRRHARYPDLGRLAAIFPSHRRTVNLVHYATREPSTLKTQLNEIVLRAGPYFDGFQLNMAWPDPAHLHFDGVRDRRIVLQIGGAAMRMTGSAPLRAVQRLNHYAGLVTDVLIDASGGQGVPLDPTIIADYVLAIQEAHGAWLNVGVAGGLGPDTLPLLEPVLAEVDPLTLSIDAERRLHGEHGDSLSEPRVAAYLQAAFIRLSPLGTRATSH